MSTLSFFLSLVAAFGLATSDALTKRFFSDRSAYEMGLIRLAYTLPWLLGASFFVSPAQTDAVFWTCVLIALPLEVLAFLCYMKALKVSPLSLSLPFLAFTPGFILLTGWFILGETVRLGGLAGILLIIVGSYFLNLSSFRQGVWQPFLAVFREPGSRLMLLVSFIYAFTATLGKLAVLHSSPSYFGIVYYLILTALMFAGLAFSGKRPGKILQTRTPGMALVLGGTMAVTIFSHMLAISLTQAAYMIALKRTSLVIGVLYGAWWFREEKIGERLAGALLMVTGVLLIGLFG
ncbi:MAG: EamA-like transporter family protein [Syntrophus sp. PtaU1.Bin208]|nr:MAG: EamA-like transporter family protein [Syntrophus sp. PtaU1.Bin208]